MFLLNLLGGALLQGPDGPLSGPPAQRHRLALLSLLACSPGHTLSREKLVGLLWPESDTDRARRLLTVGVHAVRAALGDGVLLSLGADLRLDTGRLRVDVVEFDAAVAAGDLAAAAALYGGPFLDGFFLDDSPEFERWVGAERERLSARQLGVLEELAKEAGRRGDAAAAVGWWRRASAHDPFCGRVALGAMQALAAAGDRTGALQHARMHTLLVREEYGTEADAAVEELAERLRTEVPPAPVPGAPAPAAAPVAAPPEGPQAPAFELPARTAAPRNGRAGWAPALAAAAALIAGLAVYGASAAPARGWPPFTRAAPAPAGDKSIAVLPFHNLSADPENQHLSDGIAEDILTRLARNADLVVISRTSTLQYRDTRKTLPQIAGELGVATVLEGSVRRSGNRVRVVVQLIDGRTDRHLWAETYDRELTDLFHLQSEIAYQVARILEARLHAADRESPAPGGTANLTAYEFYLRARQFSYYTGGREANEKSIRLYREALKVDSSFALAYAGLADRFAQRHVYMEGGWRDSSEAYARHALSLDPRIADGYDALGTLLRDRGQKRLALEQYRKAIELNPNESRILNRIGIVYHQVGKLDSALLYTRRSTVLDPGEPTRHRQMGFIYALLQSPAEAERWHRRALQIRPEFILSRVDLVYLYATAGDLVRARAELRTAQSLDPADPAVTAAAADLDLLAGRYAEAAARLEGRFARTVEETGEAHRQRLGYAYHRLGRHPEARELWARAEAGLRRPAVPSDENTRGRYELARLSAVQGRTDEAFHWLDEAVDRGYLHSPWMRIDPMLESIRPDPRFSGLTARIDGRVAAMRARAERERW